MTLADVITTRKAGYDLSVLNAKKTLMRDFREPTFIADALASDCGRFSCASFQSAAYIAQEMRERDTFAWSLVKLYYAAFYAGHALIRAFGEGCSFFYKKHTDHLAKLSAAIGLVPTFGMEVGLYRGMLNANATTISFLKVQGSVGGAHEAFWLVFGNKIKSVSEEILTGPLTRADAQAVFAQLDQLLQIIGRKAGYSWLSAVRNDLQYRLQYKAWYPEKVRPQVREGLSRLASQWTRDTMSIDMQNQRFDLLGDFVSSCTYIVALCREILGRIAERSSAGKRSFANTGPMAFLNDIGVSN